jgi:hypothetical protein
MFWLYVFVIVGISQAERRRAQTLGVNFPYCRSVTSFILPVKKFWNSKGSSPMPWGKRPDNLLH